MARKTVKANTDNAASDKSDTEKTGKKVAAGMKSAAKTANVKAKAPQKTEAAAAVAGPSRTGTSAKQPAAQNAGSSSAGKRNTAPASKSRSGGKATGQTKASIPALSEVPVSAKAEPAGGAAASSGKPVAGKTTSKGAKGASKAEKGASAGKAASKPSKPAAKAGKPAAATASKPASKAGKAGSAKPATRKAVKADAPLTETAATPQTDQSPPAQSLASDIGVAQPTPPPVERSGSVPLQQAARTEIPATSLIGKLIHGIRTTAAVAVGAVSMAASGLKGKNSGNDKGPHR